MGLFGGMVLLGLALLAPAQAQTAPARPPLAEVEGIAEGLLVVELGNAIRRGCPDISARFFAGVAYMVALKDKALRAGYSEAEIRAFLDNRDAQVRFREKADAWLAQRGAARSEPAALCAVGAAEIEAGTELGRLLQRNVK